MGSAAQDSRAGVARASRTWKALALALSVVLGALGGVFAYAQVWPPFLAVGSWSMQHGNRGSHLGTMDIGDFVVAKAALSKADVVTYVEGRASGYTTYGDFGDVILFREPNWGPSADPNNTFLHRAIAYVHWNSSERAYDLPDLKLLPSGSWTAKDITGQPTTNTTGIFSLTLIDAGWRHDLNITVNLAYLSIRFSHDGFITMGDNNAYNKPWHQYDPWIVSPEELIAVARGELPWFGLIRLTLYPGEGCCEFWGSTDVRRGAPLNSWIDLYMVLPTAFLAALAFSRSIIRIPVLRKQRPGHPGVGIKSSSADEDQ